MLQHFKKLWGSADDAETAPEPTSAVTPPDDEETEELDAIYRQALNALDLVETGIQSAAEDLPEDETAAPPHAAGLRQRPATDGADERAVAQPSVSPRQILEAALFVGGADLTLKRLCQLLRDEFPPERVEAFIDELNARYTDEARPYEIRFGEGGYRLSLRPEFDDVRNRVFGLGPREFKLSQDALEVLSLVAYEQPIAAERIEELRGPHSGGVLRQLLRRALIALERDDEQRIAYRTTPRFLQAFGLATLDDLPQADDLSFK